MGMSPFLLYSMRNNRNSPENTAHWNVRLKAEWVSIAKSFHLLYICIRQKWLYIWIWLFCSYYFHRSVEHHSSKNYDNNEELRDNNGFGHGSNVASNSSITRKQYCCYQCFRYQHTTYCLLSLNCCPPSFFEKPNCRLKHFSTKYFYE